MPRNLLTDLKGPEALGYGAFIPSIFPYFVDTTTDGTRGKNAENMDDVVSNTVNMISQPGTVISGSSLD